MQLDAGVNLQCAAHIWSYGLRCSAMEAEQSAGGSCMAHMMTSLVLDMGCNSTLICRGCRGASEEFGKVHQSL